MPVSCNYRYRPMWKRPLKLHINQKLHMLKNLFFFNSYKEFNDKVWKKSQNKNKNGTVVKKGFIQNSNTHTPSSVIQNKNNTFSRTTTVVSIREYTCNGHIVSTSHIRYSRAQESLLVNYHHLTPSFVPLPVS